MTIQIETLHSDFGVEVLDLDLTCKLDEQTISELKRLYYEHSLLLFRNQSLDVSIQARLAHFFGRPKIETRKQYNFLEHPEVSTIGNITDENGKPLSFFARGGFGWHTDGSAACHVDAATFLYAVEVPKEGGDTLFLSTAAAYDRTPDALKKELEGVRHLSSFHAHNDPLLESDPESFIPLTKNEREALPAVWHDAIQTHPVTGRKVFYLNFDALDFQGIEPSRGKEAFAEVLEIAAEPGCVFRHQWKPGELVIWDNHAMLHSGTPTHMYEADRRLMYRSFVYMMPTERPLPNYEEVSEIFMPTDQSIRLANFNTNSTQLVSSQVHQGKDTRIELE